MPGSLEPLDLTIQIPYHFRCLISLELMRDPVTVSTGQTYDRSSIESWIATGNTTCPVTRSPLSDFTFIPNHTLRRLIQDWCVANRCFGVERIPTPKQPAEPSLIRSLLAQISSVSSSSRLAALRRLRGLARDSEKNRSLILNQNGQEIVLQVVFSGVHESIIHEALAVVAMFPISEAEAVRVASDSEKVRCLVELLLHSSIEARVNSAAVIEMVVVGTRSSDLRAQISSVDEIHEGVVEMLRNPIPYIGSAKD
ncbi:U-box domain-containing protein 25 [Linum perenne]